jgi:hypothetical protein
LPTGLLDWVNNVTFDYGIGFILADSTATADYRANVENNYFICPPGNTRPYALSRAGSDSNGVPNFSLYLTNNLWDTDGDYLLDGYDHGWSMVSVNPTNIFKMTNAFARTAGIPVAQDSALVAYKKIVSQGGPLRLDANHPGGLRDEVATVLIASLTSFSESAFHQRDEHGCVERRLWHVELHARAARHRPRRDAGLLGKRARLESESRRSHEPSSGGRVHHELPGGLYVARRIPALPRHAARGDREICRGQSSTSQDVDFRSYTASASQTRRRSRYTIANVSTGSVTLVGGDVAHYEPPTNYLWPREFQLHRHRRRRQFVDAAVSPARLRTCAAAQSDLEGRRHDELLEHQCAEFS